MKVIQGSLIMFFYFVKYPMVFFYGVNFFYLQIDFPLSFHIFALLCAILIGKDFLFPHQKSENYGGIK